LFFKVVCACSKNQETSNAKIAKKLRKGLEMLRKDAEKRKGLEMVRAKTQMIQQTKIIQRVQERGMYNI
jgi:hypothetical protein